MKKIITLSALFLCAAGISTAETRFQFLQGAEFNGVSTAQLPVTMVRDGISLSAHAASGPVDFEDYLNTGVEPAIFIHSRDSWGLGIDSPSITNANFETLFGNDLNSESIVFNFLQSITVSFDHSIHITELAFADLELHEKFIVAVDGGPTVEIHGTTPWSTGNSGTSTWAGSDLDALEGLLIERGTRITFTFDTVDPLDRVPDGNGNDLSASPSAGIRWIEAASPETFGLGNPFIVQGGPEEATIGVELFGDDAEVTVHWGTNPDSGWDYSASLGSRSPIMITDAILDNLTPNTTWYFMFEADNGSETVQSPTRELTWFSEIYVSPEGDDASDGISPQTALRTIDEALNRIRAMGRRPQPEGPLVPNFYGSPESPHGQEIIDHLEELVDPVTIHLMAGYHYLEDTIVIDKEIDGNIHFVGYWEDGAGEVLRQRLEIHGNDIRWMDPPASHMPVVSGGKQLTGWTSTTVNGVDAWVTEIPEVESGEWEFHQLFVNGRRAERSRWPKVGWFRMEEVNNDTRLNFRVSERDARDIDLENLKNFNDVQAVALHRWVETRMLLDSYNPDTRWMDLQPPPPDPVFTLDGSHPVHGAGYAAYYFDNVFETMSEPGEWYLDRPTGRLYYIPLPGEEMETSHVVAPQLKELFRIIGNAAGSAGSTNQRVWNVTFRKIAFLHTQVDELDIHTGTGNSPYNSGRGAIHYRYARTPLVEACLFGHIGEIAVEFAEETVGGVLSSNIFRSLAFGSFKMWQSNQVANLQQRSGWAHIHDNDVKGYGLYWHGGVGLMAGETVFTTVEHNHVRNGPYSAIRVSGGNTLLRFSFSNDVRKNLAHDAGQGVLSDLAGIYAAGKSVHSVVEGNVVFNIQARDYQSQTVYLDGQAEFWTVRNNWLYGTNERNITIKGWTHDIYNNVLAYTTGDGLIDRRNGDALSANSQEFPLVPRRAPIIERNIFLQAGGGFVYQSHIYNDVIQPWAEIDNNIYWDMTSRISMDADRSTLEEFQARENQSLNSIVADPMLINPQRGDFRVDPQSPAVLEFGFVPFDNRDAGIRPEVWEAAGAIVFDVHTDPLPNWLPSDVPGLDGWLDAADLTADGALHQWESKTPFTYMMRQFDTDLQPVVEKNAANGLPLVRFDGDSWMGNHEHAWRTRQNAGQLRDREFTVVAVYKSDAPAGTVLAKGTEANNGQWTISGNNQFQWNLTQSLGESSNTELAVRSWRRSNEAWYYHENGEEIAQFNQDLEYDFHSDDIMFLGGNGNGELFEGSIGEILVYKGHVSDEDLLKIHAYLMDKWLEEQTVHTSILVSDNLEENDAAHGREYHRSLAPYIDGEWDTDEITFSKLAGPEWLVVAADGSLSGMPQQADAGLNLFTIQAQNAAGEIHVVSLDIVVAPPNPDSPDPITGLHIEVHPGQIYLEWDPSTEPDFSHYVIMRSDDLNEFLPLAYPVWENHYTDEWDEESRSFYIIRPVNTSGN
jgi:hypothetical protein